MLIYVDICIYICDICWTMLGYVCICSYMVVYVGICWYTCMKHMKHHTLPIFSTCILMFPDKSRYFLIYQYQYIYIYISLYILVNTYVEGVSAVQRKRLVACGVGHPALCRPPRGGERPVERRCEPSNNNYYVLLLNITNYYLCLITICRY